MKRFRNLILVMFAMVFTFTFAVAGCAKESEPPSDPDIIRITAISVDTSNAKLMYDLDEDFTTEGLKVIAKRQNLTLGQAIEDIELQITDEHLTIDSSQFKKGVDGTYTITVRYNNAETFENSVASYTVVVKKSIGLSITKNEVDYVFVDGGLDIPLDDISVKYATAVNGEIGEELTDSDYEFVCINEKQEEVTSISAGKLHVTEPGTYQLWAKVDDHVIPGTDNETFDLSAFVLIYVTDDIFSIKLNETPETKTSQAESPIDEMTPTWTFTVTYYSGRKVTKTAEEVRIDNLDVTEATGSEGKLAVVFYSETNGRGETTSAKREVKYVVTSAGSDSKAEYAYSFDALKAAVGSENVAVDTVKILPEMFADTANSFLTVVENGGTANYRGKESVLAMEIKNYALTVEFTGIGILTVSFSSTGGANTSDFALIGPVDANMNGEFVKASNEKDLDDANLSENEGIYCVTGTGAVTIKYIITKPGRYVLTAANEYDRYTRISSINMSEWITAE
ncbi:MAG: hypothetical protein ACI4VK_04890 [Candidatus Coproplasma sp.]